MKWDAQVPTEAGSYRWREHEQGRVHIVRVVLKKAAPVYACNSMDLRRVMAGGQWCPAKALKPGAPATTQEALDALGAID